MGKQKSYNSFSEFFANSEIELHREAAVVVHSDENIANNRLFVWNFEEDDLEEFLQYFTIYKNNPINVLSRQNLSGQLMRKMNSMQREGYNPVECMLYASKTINMRLQNDAELQELLAQRIKDVYLRQEEETISVMENIIDMWTWVPQITVIITAIGLIGDNQELFDKVMINYAEDPNYKKKVFYALMQNKTTVNLERVLKIIMNLQDTEDDNALGKIFAREITGFGYEGTKLISKYYDNPGISRTGSRVLKKIMFKEGSVTDTEDDELYRKNLANKSARDDMAFKDFKEDCYEKYDNDAFFLARFSRPEIGDFLKDALEDEGIGESQRNTIILSMGIIGEKGYGPAEALLDQCEKSGGNDYAVMIADITLGRAEYAERLADLLSAKKDFELSDLYGLLKSSGVANYNPSAKKMIQDALERKFKTLLAEGDMDKLEAITDNFQMFWNKKLWALLSWDVLEEMREALMSYSQNNINLPAAVVVSMIETVVHNWNADVEKAIFALYKNAEDQKVQELSYKKLKERKIEAPK